MFGANRKKLERKISRLGAIASLSIEQLERYYGFLEASPWGILVTNTEYEIQFINTTLEEMSGWTKKEIIGQQLEVLIPPDIREIHRVHEADYAAHPRNRHGDEPFEPELLRKDGIKLPVEISLGHKEIDGKEYFFASIRPRGTLPVRKDSTDH